MAAGSSGGVDVPISSGSFLSNIERRHKLMSKEDSGTLQRDCFTISIAKCRYIFWLSCSEDIQWSKLLANLPLRSLLLYMEDHWTAYEHLFPQWTQKNKYEFQRAEWLLL